MNNVHVTFQAKGGVGKSMIASFIAAHLQQRQRPGEGVLAIDTDPLNASLSQYPALQARMVPPPLAGLTDMIAAHRGDAVIDTGPAAYFDVHRYLVDGQAANVLAKANRSLTVHCVIAGGTAQDHTLTCLLDLVRTLPPSIRIVVWLNHYFGKIASPAGQSFAEMKIYAEHRARLGGVVTLTNEEYCLFTEDLREMLIRRQTFSEAVDDPELGIMVRHRLGVLQDDLVNQLDAVLKLIPR